MIHELKCWPRYYQQHINGSMLFTHRKNDRDYHEGDSLLLQEYDNERSFGMYTGQTRAFQIIKVWHNLPGVDPGYVVLSIKTVAPEAGKP